MRRIVVLLSVFAFFLAACGDDDGITVADSSTTASTDDSGDDTGDDTGDGDDTTSTEADTTTTTEPRATYTDGFEVDYDTGNVTIEGYAAFLAEHGAPVGGPDVAAVELLGSRYHNLDPNVSSMLADGMRTVVTVEYDDLNDDSVTAERYEIVFVGEGDEMIIESGSWASRCHEGRGHQDYQVALCV